jgi:cytochrome P450
LKPPGPTGYPLIGNTPQFVGDSLAYLEMLRERYGDVVSFSVGVRSVALFHPEHIGQVLKQTQTLYRKGSEANGYAFNSVFGNGLVTSEGEFWRKQRQLAQPAFHAQRIGRYADTMIDFGREMLATWAAGDLKDIGLHREMMLLTQRIAVKTLFGVDVGARAADIRDALDYVLREIGDEFNGLSMLIPGWLPTPGRRKFDREMAKIDRYLADIIAFRQTADAATSAHQDLLAMLMEARDDQDQPMSAKQLRDEIMTLYLAGHETTSNTLSWAFMLLAQNPEARRALEAELAQALNGREPTFEDARRLPYTSAVIKETMRLRSPVWSFVRMTNQDVDIGGYHIPKDTLIWLNQWVTHRDARWFPEPERFDPTRWLNGADKAMTRYAYFPFGGGPRICIGNAFSELESVLLLAQIAQRYRLNLEPGADTRPRPSLTLQPVSSLRMSLEAR